MQFFCLLTFVFLSLFGFGFVFIVLFSFLCVLFNDLFSFWFLVFGLALVCLCLIYVPASRARPGGCLSRGYPPDVGGQLPGQG